MSLTIVFVVIFYFALGITVCVSTVCAWRPDPVARRLPLLLCSLLLREGLLWNLDSIRLASPAATEPQESVFFPFAGASSEGCPNVCSFRDPNIVLHVSFKFSIVKYVIQT